MRGALTLLAAYMWAVVIPLTVGTRVATIWLLVIHIVLLVLVMRRLRAGPHDPALWAALPLCCGPVLYLEIPSILTALHRARFDGAVQSWDAMLFGTQMSHRFALAWPFVFFSEIVHACYLAYYALLVVPAVYFWRTGRVRELNATITSLVVVFILCFVCYIIFPVDGPRFLFGPASAPYGPLRQLTIALLHAGSSRGTAFPSSHVAASLTASLATLRFHRTIGAAMLVITLGLAVGAVYGGYHYAIDVVYGSVIALVALRVARRLERVEWSIINAPPAVFLDS